MRDREVGLTGMYPEKTADIPAAGEARVERERTVDQPDHGTDVLPELTQHESGVREDARVVLPRLERTPGKIYALAAGCLRRFGPTVSDEPQVADRCPGECRPVMRIDHDRLFEQAQSPENPLSCYRIKGGKRTQIEIIGAEIGRLPRCRSAHLGGLQCRFNNTGDAQRHLILKLKDVFEGAIEPV